MLARPPLVSPRYYRASNGFMNGDALKVKCHGIASGGLLPFI